jgi:hypothetical protein
MAHKDNEQDESQQKARQLAGKHTSVNLTPGPLYREEVDKAAIQVGNRA